WGGPMADVTEPLRAVPVDLPGGRTRIDSQRGRTWRRFRRHRLALAGLVFIGILTVMGIFAPVVAPIDPIDTDMSISLQPPNGTHWLGTDIVGRDVWSRVVYAIRISLSVGIVSVGILVAISLVLGTLSGYYGGAVDMVIMRATDVIMNIPSLIIIMAVVSVI